MLPFDIPDKHKRKYQCFVCGCQFTEFSEYKEHIIEKHDEGRDYVLCPLSRCQAPVRCIKTHFKAKHPSEKVPKVGQMKAMIWRDIKNGKEIKTRKPRFRQGWHQSIKTGASYYFRSGEEKKCYEALDHWDEVAGYEAEPFEIPYIWGGNSHNYTPDIIVCFVDGRKEVWEIKPASQTLLEQNKAKWFAAERACEPRGWKFEVYTESRINKLRKSLGL